MIKQLPEEYEVVNMRCFQKKFSCPTTESFAELRGAVIALIDHINNQQPKKPKSTNIALRQKIAVLEQNNNVLQQKCEEYLGKLTEAKQALDWLAHNHLASNFVRVEQLRRYARNALEQINRKED